MTNSSQEETLVLTAYINASITAAISFVAICSNFMILVIYVCCKDVRSLSNTAVTLLSFGDFLRAIIIMPTKTYNQFTLATELREPMCMFTAITSGFSFVYNPMILALIAVVRYFKIVPWTNRSTLLNKKKLLILSFVLFLIAILFSCLPHLGIGQYEYSKAHGVCFTDWSKENREFRIIFYSLVVGIAFPVLTLCYVKLYIALRQHKNNILSAYTQYEVSKFSKSSSNETITSTGGQQVEEKANVACCTSGRIAVVGATHQNTESEKYCRSVSEHKKRVAKILSRQEYQVTKLLIIIFIAYCICWFPAAVVNIAALININNIPTYWYFIIVTLVEFKSALDPLIYGLGNRVYRRRSKSLLKQLFFK